MKKTALLILFSLLSISMFASGHGANVIGALIEFAIAVFAYAGLFVVLTILTMINAFIPGKIRSAIYLIVFSCFTIVFIYFFARIMDISAASGDLTLSRFSLYALCGFILLFTLNLVFLVMAYVKLKKGKPKP